MTIEAMKQALEALESFAPHNGVFWRNLHKEDAEIAEAITSLRQAIAEAEKQEPVAWLHKETALLRKEKNKPKGADWDADHWNPLYTHPQPKRELVGLWAEEREQVQTESYGKVPHHVALIAAVEAKLKAKNFA